MGTYLNPGNEGFKKMLSSDYVDKTGLIELINNSIGTTGFLTCVSRPRRFGKSFTAKMLSAYYDRSCDSHELFDGLNISGTKSYEEFLNKYNVIYLDMAGIVEEAGGRDVAEHIKNIITQEIINEFPQADDGISFSSLLVNAAKEAGRGFIMIIDEWDAVIREQPKYEVSYLRFLRMLFKNSGITDNIFSAVYMTGILPIKKDGSQSALSDFQEYTMLEPGEFAEYVGFTSGEVKDLCNKYNCDFYDIKQWYDGYIFDHELSIYNPNSVMKAVTSGKLRSYWIQSAATDNLFDFINMDFEGLSKTVTEIIGGVAVKIDPYDFSNDLLSFDGANSVLVALVHLGYLAYDSDTNTVFIPNDEIRMEFSRSLGKFKSGETLMRVKESNRLIMDTVHMDEQAVAKQIEKVHEEEAAALFYNNEQALRGIIKLAYFAYRDYYIKFEELPAGAGFADIVYFPKKDTTLPALLIELKWEKSAEGAIAQIKKKHYPEALKDYGGELLLVGINYDKDAPAGERKHSCVIEKL